MKFYKTALFISTMAVWPSGYPAYSQQAAPARTRAAAPARSQPVVSPEILPDKRVTFRLAAPNASEVLLNGDWPDGSGVAMTKNDAGVWSVTVGPLAPELWGYSYRVDGITALDPGNPDTKRDGRRIDNILLIPGPESTLYEVHDVPHGTVSMVWYDSPTLGTTRRMSVYTPPGYETSRERYPVLYLHHGGGGDEEAWTALGRAPEILDNLIAAGKAKPMIAVMPNFNDTEVVAQGSALRTALPTPVPRAERAPQVPREQRTGSGSWPLDPYPDSYAESLVKDLIPFVESHYRVDATAAGRAIAGLSRGGGPVVSATNNNPDTFGYIAIFSSRPTADEALEKDLTALKDAGQVKLYWVSVGTTDFANEGGKEVYDMVNKVGFNAVFRETPGGHTWAVWRINLSELATMLFR